ncbi:MAG: hypothetical protein IPG72_09670 [Ardenticatenales bacterium]|jgi:hypothetical protein|nr:hypothetical protein [Ardenticatenales bacterium]
MDAESPPGDRSVVLISLVLAGIAVASLATIPPLRLSLNILGSPLGIAVDGVWLIGALVVAMTAVGMDAIVRIESGHANVDARFAATFWILPCLVTLAAAVAIPRLHAASSVWVAQWVASVILLGGLLTLVIVAERHTIQLDDIHYRTARLGLNFMTYGAALALYAAIHGLHQRSLISVPAVCLVTFPLALEILRSSEEQLENTWVHAGIVALILGELTWGLNLQGVSALRGGGILLVAFYVFCGIAQQHLAGRLTRRVVMEYAATAAVGLGLIVWSGGWG